MPQFEIKVLEIEVREWRNLKDIAINISPGDTLVCLVGENGTGKSAILELISAAAHRAGLTPGVDLPRGDPFSEPHDLRLVLQVTTESKSFAGDLPEEVAEH